MWVKMITTDRYTDPADRRRTTRFRADCRYSVKRAVGTALIARGTALEAKAPRRPSAEPAEGSAE